MTLHSAIITTPKVKVARARIKAITIDLMVKENLLMAKVRALKERKEKYTLQKVLKEENELKANLF
jgi:hypothetical protein